MTTRALRILTALGAGLLALAVSLVPVPTAWAATPKFYFRLGEVKAGPNVEVDADLKTYAGEALKAELASRPEWASDVGTNDPEALAAELKRRNLRGFSVAVRFEHFKKDLKEPSPGARRKRAVVDVKLSVFGTTIPEEKLSFSGDGESGVEAEVSEKGALAETQVARQGHHQGGRQAGRRSGGHEAVRRKVRAHEREEARQKEEVSMSERARPPRQVSNPSRPRLAAVGLAVLAGPSPSSRAAPAAGRRPRPPRNPRRSRGSSRSSRAAAGCSPTSSRPARSRRPTRPRACPRASAADRARLRSGRHGEDRCARAGHRHGPQPEVVEDLERPRRSLCRAALTTFETASAGPAAPGAESSTPSRVPRGRAVARARRRVARPQGALRPPPQ